MFVPAHQRDPSWDGVEEVVAAVRHLPHRPVLVAIDGRSGAGKSTLAARLASELGAVVVPGDDFYACSVSDAEWDAMSPQERADRAIDWRRLRREALEPLLAGRTATWRPFDFSSPRPDGTFPLGSPTTLDTSPVIVLEGAYASRPELQNLVSLSVLVEAPDEARLRRLAEREDPSFLAAWHSRWDAAEEFYFTRVRPPGCFDLVVRSL